MTLNLKINIVIYVLKINACLNDILNCTGTVIIKSIEKYVLIFLIINYNNA